MTDPLDDIREDVSYLREWVNLHEERHGDDADMLGRVLDHIAKHDANAHGRVSTIKQNTGVMAGVLTVLYVAVELLRRFFL